MNRKKIVSLGISPLSYKQVLHEIIRLGTQRTPAYVCFANAHMTIEAYRSSSFARQVNDATIVAPDGMPIAKAIRWFYNIRQERVAGMDMMASIIAECAQQHLSLFFFGATDEILRAIQTRISKEHSGLKIAGMYSPPFGLFRPEDNDRFVKMINESGAHVILISLGCPKQESWMAEHYKRVNGVLVGIGGVFSVYGGLRKRAPYWMQRMALEWLYRLAQEPGRMFKRYLVSNTLFIILLIRQWLRSKFRNNLI